MPPDKVVPRILRPTDRKNRLCMVPRRWRIINYLLRHFL